MARLLPVLLVATLSSGPLLALPAQAATEALPAKLSARMLLKALSYDQNLVQRSGDALRIGVLVQTDNPTSESDGAEFASELRNMLGKSSMRGFISSSAQGLPLGVELIRVGSAAELASRVSAQQINVLYLSAGWSTDQVREVIAFADRSQLPVLAGAPDQVEAGAAVGAFKLDGKPRLVVHVPGSMRQGARFDGGLLRLASLVR